MLEKQCYINKELFLQRPKPLDIPTFISLFSGLTEKVDSKPFHDDFAVLEIDPSVKPVGVARFGFTSVLLCLSGSLDSIVGQHQFTIKAHDIAIIPAEHINALSGFSADFKAKLIVFRSDFLRKGFLNTAILDELLYINPDYPPIFELDTDNFEANVYKFDKILEEQNKTNPFFLDMIRLYLVQILFDYNRVCEICLLNSTTNMNRQFQIVHKFRKLIDLHFATLKTVKEYADLLHITPKYLSECTKQQLGYSAIDLIHQRILLESEFLLRYSELTIKEISIFLNFDTISHFGRFFKAQKKQTPSEYRQIR